MENKLEIRKHPFLLRVRTNMGRNPRRGRGAAAAAKARPRRAPRRRAAARSPVRVADLHAKFAEFLRKLLIFQTDFC